MIVISSKIYSLRSASNWILISIFWQAIIIKAYKFVTIVVEEKGTKNVFVATGVAVGYVWNSSVTNMTDILRSVPAIGRELPFLFDIYLSSLLPLVYNNVESAYLCEIGSYLS